MLGVLELWFDYFNIPKSYMLWCGSGLCSICWYLYFFLHFFILFTRQVVYPLLHLYQTIIREGIMKEVCCECGEIMDGKKYCPNCGCDDYDMMYEDDYQDMITGGIDHDAA